MNSEKKYKYKSAPNVLVGKAKQPGWTGKERHQWMAALLLGSACLYLSRTIMPLCNVTVSSELGWSKRTSGMVLGSFFWGYTCTQFLGGYLSDKLGGERVVTAAAYAWATVTIAIPFIPWLFDDPQLCLTVFLLFRVLQGMSQGFHYPSMGSLMAHRVQLEERTYTWSCATCGSHIGTLLCGSIGSLITQYYGWRTAFVLIGICGLLWAYITRAVLVNSPAAADHDKELKPVDIHAVEPAPWGKILRSPAFWAMIVGHFAHANSYFILLSWTPTYFHDNFPDARAWVFNVVPWLVTVPAQLGSGLLADWLLRQGHSVTLVRKSLETASLLLTALFLYLLSYTRRYWLSLMYMALAVCSCGFHNSAILVNPHDLVPSHGGAVFGVMNIFGAVPGFIGVYMVGSILEATKSWAAVFMNTASICVIGAAVYAVFGSGRRIA